MNEDIIVLQEDKVVLQEDKVYRSKKVKKPKKSSFKEDKIELIVKKEIYCGDKKKLPDGYDSFGTRRKCLSKGYGSAYYNASIKKMKEDRKKSKIRGFSVKELYKLAERFKIKYKNRDRLDTLEDVIQIFRKMKDNIKDQ